VYLSKLIRPVAELGYRVVLFHPGASPAAWVEEIAQHAETVAYSNGRPAPEHAPVSIPGLQGGGPLEVARRVHRGLTPRSVRYAMGFLREAWRLRRTFERHPVHVLHSPDLGVHPFILGARLAGVPRITGALGCLPSTEPFRCGWTFRALEALCLSCVDAIAAVSASGRNIWQRRDRGTATKTRVIYNGIEVAPQREEVSSRETRREIGVPDRALVVGVSAGLAPVKGHRYLLDAFPAVLRSVPEARVMLAGDGPCRKELQRQAEELGISDRVTFLGHRDDIDRVVEAYDVIALPSLSESMPFSLLEGMARGKPVVASAVGGIPELVEDGRTGYLVPPGDSHALARALVRVLSDQRTTVRMGQAARERVQEYFSLERMVRETVDMMLGTSDE